MSQTDSMLDVYVYENLQLLEELETILLSAEKEERFTGPEVDAIFRVLHTVKGSSAMMSFDGLTHLSHAMEDLFSCIRADREIAYDHPKLCFLSFAVQDFLRSEIEQLQEGAPPSRDPAPLLGEIDAYCKTLKADGPVPKDKDAAKAAPAPAPASAQNAPAEGKRYRARIMFEKGCMMENVRAFGVIKSIEALCASISTVPEDVLRDDSEEYIVENGFTLTMVSSAAAETLKEKIAGNFFIAALTFEELPEKEPARAAAQVSEEKAAPAAPQAAEQAAHQKQAYLNVRIEKLDKLMELVGEIVISESIVAKNPDIQALRLDSFDKATRQLGKLTDELQDTVMSMRMLSVSTTFHRLERIVRDVCVKTGKQADLVIRGEETEMDKSVIDNLGDPLMHIVRNAVDHGIEPPDVRRQMGKPAAGRVTLEAYNAGGEVVISASDDGQGLDRAALLKKASEKGLLKKRAEEMTDREVYSLIFEPGFSTNSVVTEFSGRGVGMDVVRRDIEKIGGNVSIDSTLGKGMSVHLRIPQTLAIIECMQVGVGRDIFLVPLLSIIKSFQPSAGELLVGPDGREMALLRGKCYPIMRLHRSFAIPDAQEAFENGILVQVSSAVGEYCLFVDKLLGEQQTVIKPLPAYISQTMGAQKGVSGCTILGDGSVSLILDVNGLME